MGGTYFFCPVCFLNAVPNAVVMPLGLNSHLGVQGQL